MTTYNVPLRGLYQKSFFVGGGGGRGAGGRGAGGRGGGGVGEAAVPNFFSVGREGVGGVGGAHVNFHCHIGAVITIMNCTCRCNRCAGMQLFCQCMLPPDGRFVLEYALQFQYLPPCVQLCINTAVC